MSIESVINIWPESPDFSPLQSHNTQVRKIVIGDSPTDNADASCLAIAELPDFDVEFPNLSHLYLWSTTNLRTLPALPAQMKVVEVRRSLELTSIESLPTNLEALVIEDCEQLNRLPDLSGQRFDQLRDLSLARCPKIPTEWIQQLLLSAPNLWFLDLSGCTQIDYLSSSAAENISELQLSSLRKLTLNLCESLKDIAPIARFLSLQTLDLSECQSLREFLPARGLVSQLKQLYVSGGSWIDLPIEICGSEHENVIDKVRPHVLDLLEGETVDAELKVCVLGNGGVGKTQMCRRLNGEDYDPRVPSTHGIQIGHWSITLPDVSSEPVRLNVWDFGGQDIYLGSHALFLQGPAVFIILWNPESERGEFVENGLTIRNRPLAYWIEYVRNLAGPDVRMLVVQSKCDIPSLRRAPPQPQPGDVSLRAIDFSAKTDLGLEVVRAEIKEVARDLLAKQPLQTIGVGRFKVRNQLREWLENDSRQAQDSNKKHRILSMGAFKSLCDDVGGISDPEALLDYLHHTGVVSYRPPLFDGQIILDQTWALAAVYAVFHRQDSAPFIKRDGGRFTRSELARHIWRRYNAAEQELFISMMQSCGICFPVREVACPEADSTRGSTTEWEYIVPELLPEWNEVQEKLLGRLRKETAVVEATAEFSFLHEGVLRGFLSAIGGVAGDSAIYWKYGCWFAAALTEQRLPNQELISVPVLIESRLSNDLGSGAGSISIKCWHRLGTSVVENLLKLLATQPISAHMRIQRSWREQSHDDRTLNADVQSVDDCDSKTLDEELQSLYAQVEPATQLGRHGARLRNSSNLIVPKRPDLSHTGPRSVFISFAWGDDQSEQGRARTRAVDVLEQKLKDWGYNPLVDRNQLRNGDLISGYMKKIGRGELVLVILSEKYLRSIYCLTELYYVYQRAHGEQAEFLRRIIPMVLDDANIDDWRARRDHNNFWRNEYEEMDASFKDLGNEDRRACQLVKQWHLALGDILYFISDKLAPRTWEAICANDFAALKELLERTQSDADEES